MKTYSGAIVQVEYGGNPPAISDELYVGFIDKDEESALERVTLGNHLISIYVN